MMVSSADCCGCGACRSACPVNAIRMEEDSCGFVYPRVNQEICIRCGKCDEVCPVRFEMDSVAGRETFAAVAKEADLRNKAASGGVFSVLAEKMLEKGGVVFGAAFVGKDRVEHVAIREAADLPRLQGSKYVQSDIAETFAEVKRALLAGEQVLYSGTPCQIAGLLGFLGGRHENLLTVDLVCHGVPSGRMFADYVRSLERRLGAKVEEFCFRDKAAGWGLNGSARLNGRRKILWQSESPYLGCFAKGWIYRESCYRCRYAGAQRPGDLTLGDFWGIESAHPEYLGAGGWNERRGVSLVIANTVKGLASLRECADTLDVRPSSFEKAAAANAQLREPSKPGRRSEVLSAYRSGGWDAVETLYFRRLGWRRYESRFKALIPRCLKRWSKSRRKYD